MTAVVLVAWAVMVVHNMADLPIALTSRENVLPGLVWLLLLALWAAMRAPRWATQLLLVWGVINVIGAVVTVLPLAVLPFEPAQSVRHYAFHVLYATMQWPFLRQALIEMRRTRIPLGAER